MTRVRISVQNVKSSRLDEQQIQKASDGLQTQDSVQEESQEFFVHEGDIHSGGVGGEHRAGRPVDRHL